VTHPTNLDRVRALCEVANLPISEPELEVLAPLYELFSSGLEQLALLVEDSDSVPLRFAPDE
jgi:hypothetical protein